MADHPVALQIGINDVPVGVMRKLGADTSFELLDEYLRTPRRPVLGQAFEDDPLRRWSQHQRLVAWFSNLLPEGGLRDLVCNFHGISPQSEYKLMCLMLDDLPGALTAGPIDGELLLKGIREEADDQQAGRAIASSIAGVEMKLAVIYDPGGLTVPGAGQYSNMILKFRNPYYENVPWNESVTMTWASASGVSVAEASLIEPDRFPILPDALGSLRAEKAIGVTRFDRSPDGGRVHQEDFNQVLMNWPDRKYQGASYERLALLISTICGHEDYLEFIRRLVFCIACGNEDAHLKNWSVIYTDGVIPRLTPAYDLVSTVQYPDLTRGLALRFGGSRKFRYVQTSSFGRLATKAGENAEETLDCVADTLTAIDLAARSLADVIPAPPGYWEAIRTHWCDVPLLAGLRT